MPCTFTHAVFSEEIYNQIKDKSNLEDLKFFSQGPDSFNFYNLISVFKGKKYRNLATYIQNNKTKDFFINLIKYIKNNNLEKNKEIMSFLYGFMCHYFLDKTTHPYIIYKSGEFNLKDKSTYKYNNNHHEIEVYIDCYLINKTKKTDHTKFKIHNFCFNKNDFSNEFKNAIDYVFYKTYKFKYISKIYIKSLNQMKLFYKYFRYDETKTKKHIYSFIDFFTPIQIPKIKIASYNIKLNKQNYLNKNKNYWNHPTNKKEKYNYSFEELYLISKKDCLKAIKEVNKVLFENKNINILNKVFLNLSYKTNKNCNSKLKHKYFEN